MKRVLRVAGAGDGAGVCAADDLTVQAGGTTVMRSEVREYGPPRLAGDYNGTRAYARAKRAQVTLAELWATRLAADRISVHSLHPGWADTPGVARSLPTFRRVVGPLLRTPAEGADTLIWLAVVDGAPLQESGRFWLNRRPRPLHRLASTRRFDTPDERERLWSWAIQKSGLVI